MTGRVVIVTGGFGTLGRAVADAFARAGDRVARVDFAAAPPDTAAALDLAGRDIADPAVAAAAIAEIVSALGDPEVLINVAGGFVWETLDADAGPSWERMFRINALTALHMSRAALPFLRQARHGRIVNIGAHAALGSAAGMGAYAASKAAVHRMTESLADELQGSTVTANAVLPTIIDTPANRADMPDADFASWVKPGAIAEAIVFLASPAARAINGALLPVSRGREA